MKKVIIWLTLIFIIAHLALAEDVYHLKLLAVQEEGQNLKGSDADLYLELKDGSGRVFLETFPLTKIDTQISTRFAKDIACKYIDFDCTKYDFIYTIKAKSNIIGGPSAGAAISALTAIALLNEEYDEKITLTGTINSGGIIGPVGGVKEKIEAAKAAGMRKVLIPKGSSQQQITLSSNESNETVKKETPLNLTKYAQENLSIEVVEVIDLEEVLEHFTGKKIITRSIVIEENKEYTKIMQKLQENLCSRYDQLVEEYKKVTQNKNISNTAQIKRLSGENATVNGDFYSAASFCFGANIDLRSQLYKETKPSTRAIEKQFLSLEKERQELEEEVKKEKIETISDLQTFMIVMERINDVKKQEEKFKVEIKEKKAEDFYASLAYAQERLHSAKAWKNFFVMTGKKFTLDEASLEQSCLQKVAEADERAEYVSLFLDAETIREKIIEARKFHEQREFSLCLMIASQAKADADAILGSLSLGEDVIDAFIESKSEAVAKVISHNIAQDIFPILGFSYYQYANSLKSQEKFTTLLYLEYALEASDLEIYFPPKEDTVTKLKHLFTLPQKYIILGEGILIGIVVTMTLQGIISRVSKKTRHEKYPKTQRLKK